MSQGFHLKRLGYVSALLLTAGLTTQAQAVNSWHIDFQGDNTHGGQYGQTDPVDMSGAETWNIFNIKALDPTWPSGTPTLDSNLSLSLVDASGDGSAGVSFAFSEDMLGWAGAASQESMPLQGDYLIVGAGPLVDALGFTISGLDADTQYELTYYHAINNGGRGLDLTANGIQSSVNGGAGADVATAVVTTDANGEIIGSAAMAGSEGDWAGLVITEVPEPASMALVGLGALAFVSRRK